MIDGHANIAATGGLALQCRQHIARSWCKGISLELLLRRGGRDGRRTIDRRLIELGDQLIGLLQDLRIAAYKDAVPRRVGNGFDARRGGKELGELLARRFGIGLMQHVGFETRAVVGRLWGWWNSLTTGLLLCRLRPREGLATDR